MRRALRPIANECQPDRPIDPDVRIGHVHLKVADLDRALAFYCGVLGFELMQRYGTQAAFVSAGRYHHHIGLNTWVSLGGSPPPADTTGLYHLAILYPTRAALADALQWLIAAGVPLDGASDHGVSEALYLRDPDENGVELYWDRPAEQWPRNPEGQLDMFTRRLDLAGLLQSRAEPWSGPADACYVAPWVASYRNHARRSASSAPSGACLASIPLSSHSSARAPDPVTARRSHLV